MKKKPTLKQKELYRVLNDALLLDGEMHHALYEHELKEHIGYWKNGLARDGEDFVFVVTVNRGHAAMLAITKQGDLMVNEIARAYIKGVWMENYSKNMKMLLPGFVDDLDNDCFALTEVKIVSASR